MIEFRKAPGQRILELGCGANRNPASDVAVDVRPGPGVDFAVNLAEPDWPIGSDEFDAVLSVFCLEHIPYPAVPAFLKEALRVLKPGGRAVILIPNTEAQLKWILAHPDGWDGKGPFVSASCKLFGDQEHGKRLGAEDAGVDSHKAYFNPVIAVELFNAAGFEGVIAAPFGERATDMIVEAKKPTKTIEQIQNEWEKSKTGQEVEPSKRIDFSDLKSEEKEINDWQAASLVPTTKPVGAYTQERWEEIQKAKPAIPYEPAKLFNRQYFDFGGLGYPMGYMDFPQNELIARHVLARKPQSVLELGCGRGYLLKKLQDVGIDADGFDVSLHCMLTRVAKGVTAGNACNGDSWLSRCVEKEFCLSISFLEHIPEDRLPALFADIERKTKRGLHGIAFVGNGHDTTQVTLKPRAWWVERMPAGHDVVDINELRAGKLPPEYFRSAGDLIKLNLGCHLTQFHHGWYNLDALDMSKFAQANGFNFQQRDLRQGLIQFTGTVDAIFCHHVLEHFDYKDGLSLLRDCRRVLKPETGALRIVVPDTGRLTQIYVGLEPGTGACMGESLGLFDEMNGGCAEAKTPAAKLHALLQGGDHRAFYDAETLVGMLEEAGFEAGQTEFRRALFNHTRHELILKECLEMDYGGTSLFVDAIPKVG